MVTAPQPAAALLSSAVTFRGPRPDEDPSQVMSPSPLPSSEHCVGDSQTPYKVNWPFPASFSLCAPHGTLHYLDQSSSTTSCADPLEIIFAKPDVIQHQICDLQAVALLPKDLPLQVKGLSRRRFRMQC